MPMIKDRQEYWKYWIGHDKKEAVKYETREV